MGSGPAVSGIECAACKGSEGDGSRNVRVAVWAEPKGMLGERGEVSGGECSAAMDMVFGASDRGFAAELIALVMGRGRL